MFREVTVVAPLAVCGIADDRMGDVLQVAPDLMTPTGDRFHFQQRVAAGRIAIDLDWQFDLGQFAEVGQRRLGFATALLPPKFVGITLA